MRISIQEVVEREVARHHPGRVLFGLLLIDDFFEVLHQADDVAHAEHAARHAFGAERLELVGGLAHADEQHRGPGHFLDAERGAAAGVAVELGQHHAGQRQRLVEAARGLDRVLTDHRVDDQEHVVRLHRRADRRQLLHQRLVDREAAGGVVDDHVAAELRGFGLGGLADLERRRAGMLNTGTSIWLAEHLQLLDGGRALHVGGDEQRLLAFLGQVARELGGARGLTGALQADHHDAGGSAVRELERLAFVRHQRHQLVVANLDELLARTDAVGLAAVAHRVCTVSPTALLFHAGQEALDDAQLDVGLEQRGSHLPQRGLDVFWLELGEAGEAVLSLAKPLC